MNEAEQNSKEALEIYRRLASRNPAAYQEHVAGMLFQLAWVHWHQKDVPQSRKEVEEAIAIYKEPWNSNPAVYGDSNAMALYLYAKVLMEQEPLKACDLVKQAAKLAHSSYVKQMASSEFPGCKFEQTNRDSN